MLTLCVSFDHSVTKIYYVVGCIIGNVLPEDHVLIKVSSIKKTGGKSDFLDICVDMVLAFL